MSTPLTAIPGPPPATYPLIAPGDGVTSANFAQTAQPIINTLGWVTTRIVMLSPELAAPTGSDWLLAHFGVTFRAAWVQNALTHGDSLRWPLGPYLLQGQKITAITIDWVAATHASLPATMPALSLKKTARGLGTTIYAFSSPTVTNVQSVSDSAALSPYQTLHTISVTLGTPEVVDLTAFAYELVFFGEASTNSTVGGYAADARVSVGT